MPEIVGSCLCGSVRYRSSAQPALTAFCHCRNCQKAGGGGYSVNVAVPTDSLSIDGELASYSGIGTSGQPVTRRFCPRCGSPMFTEGAAFAGMSFVKAATLDDPSWIESKLHIWCDSMQPWDFVPEGATRVARNPLS